MSDTHSYLDENVLRHFETCDEIWHAGDFGNVSIANQLAAIKPLRGVWGNIDGQDIRTRFPETLRFNCEQVDVLIKHIGGYPGKYAPAVREIMRDSPPQIFISGHSHILKIMFDDKFNCLHINPGACGREGWHKVRTVVRFAIDGEKIRDCEVIELGKR